MSKSLRKFPRKEIEVEVELLYLDEKTRSVLTRDMSEGGLFIKIPDSNHYIMGEMVNLRFKNPLDNSTETQKDGIIVRKTDIGIGIAFIEMGDV